MRDSRSWPDSPTCTTQWQVVEKVYPYINRHQSPQSHSQTVADTEPVVRGLLLRDVESGGPHLVRQEREHGHQALVQHGQGGEELRPGGDRLGREEEGWESEQRQQQHSSSEGESGLTSLLVERGGPGNRKLSTWTFFQQKSQ